MIIIHLECIVRMIERHTLLLRYNTGEAKFINTTAPNSYYIDILSLYSIDMTEFSLIWNFIRIYMRDSGAVDTVMELECSFSEFPIRIQYPNPDDSALLES